MPASEPGVVVGEVADALGPVVLVGAVADGCAVVAGPAERDELLHAASENTSASVTNGTNPARVTPATRARDSRETTDVVRRRIGPSEQTG
jgi:hypothetical protein